MGQVQPQVHLVSRTADPDEIHALAARLCTTGGNDILPLMEQLENRDLPTTVRSVIERGHLSVIEHASFTFGIEGVSRAFSHQLVRHRIASYSQQSQRYVEFDNMDYIVPANIAKDPENKADFITHMNECVRLYRQYIDSGVPGEDARFVLPNACETKLIMTMNGRALMNFFGERLCGKAQWEIRAVAHQMVDALVDSGIEATFMEYVGPKCTSLGHCPEKDSCGYIHRVKMDRAKK